MVAHKQKGNIMKVILVLIFLAAPWVVNAYKFAHCDFEAAYKCEVIHGIGIFIAPAAWVTVWFGTDENS